MADLVSISMEGTQEAAEIEEAEDTDAALIDVEDLVTDMKRMLVVLPESEPYTTIPRVPVYIREGNKKLYDPMSFAIGPYHHGKEHLQAMEKHKWRYLRDLLSRSTTEASLEDCLRTMKTLEEEARRCYSESIALKSDEFVKMMVLDSGFIIELAFKLYYRDDINLGRCFDYLHLDLLSLENQIPFFIIQRLFNLVDGSTDENSNRRLFVYIRRLYLMDSAFKERSQSSTEIEMSEHFRGSFMEEMRPLKAPPKEILHLLHYYYHCFVPTEKPGKSNHRSLLVSSLPARFPWMSEESETSENSGKPNFLIPSASVLRRTGVIFKKKNSPCSNFDITFRNGLMEIPSFSINDTTKPLFTNLIAFEQSMPTNEPRTMTSFCTLMNSLIHTEKDVALLQHCDIINNLLGGPLLQPPLRVC